MERYWNDSELMTTIAAKLDSMNMGPATPERATESSKVTSLS